MKATFTPVYGPASILEIRDAPLQDLGEHDVRDQVEASPVTAGDRRLRSADFPGISAVPGRLMMGVFRPRRAIQGTMFAGRISAVGEAVTRYKVGDDVFGAAEGGAYAEYLSMAEDGPMALIPEGMGYDEAAAVPYGAGTSLHFLCDVAKLQRGERLLVLGASGGVGRYAIQLAKHLGATVTAVCSPADAPLVRELGADEVIDYHLTDFTETSERYDVIFDIADATTFSRCRGSLTDTGRYLTVYVSLGVLFHMARTAMTTGPTAKVSVAMPSRDDMEQLAALMAQGVLRPVIARTFPLERIVEAHQVADLGRLHGEVIVRSSSRT